MSDQCPQSCQGYRKLEKTEKMSKIKEIKKTGWTECNVVSCMGSWNKSVTLMERLVKSE